MHISLNAESTPFNLYHTLDCGQVFRWENMKNGWYGVVRETVIKVMQIRDELVFQTFPDDKGISFIRRYFRLDDDLPQITSKIDKDAIIHRAIDKLYGLRIIRQEPWECIVSYICATFSNISRIKGMIRNLSRKFGKEIIYNGLTFYAFPQIEVLAKATLRELSDCGLGFRSKYVQYAARAIKDYIPDFESLKRLTYQKSKRLLLSLPGIGPKVADCILLFSINKLGAFPVDIWIKRILCKYYSKRFPDYEFVKKKGITLKRYEQLSAFGRSYFGEYAGYAQEYLFYYYRLNRSSGHWPSFSSLNLSEKEFFISPSSESAYLPHK